MITNKNLLEEESQPSCLGDVMRSCVHCGNKKDFEVWTELEYDDGSDEPTTGNHLINVEFVKCLKCGEVL